MADAADSDLLSDLPLSIVETILALLPVRDAIKTSLLSNKWRYRWAHIPQLVFDDRCISPLIDKANAESSLIKFVTHALLLHEGPIYKFKLCTTHLLSCPEIDQWLLFLSRNGIRELSLDLGDGEWFKVPSCLFACKKLTHLELLRCELDTPPSFRGFLCLTSLNLQQVCVDPDDIESLIANCPLLESLTLSYFDSLELSISAPKLKELCLEGEFREICLVNTPLLSVMSIALYMTDDIAEHFEQSTSCNFVKFLGGAPNLERLIGHIYFTKYLSVGIDKPKLQLVYNNLKTIELYQVSFEDMKEITVVLRLIMNSPKLEELHLSGSSNTLVALEAPDLDFWESRCPSDCTFKCLKTVKMTDMCGVPHEMGLIKFLLANSPSLKEMSINPCAYITDGRINMLIELLRFRRASALAEIRFIQD